MQDHNSQAFGVLYDRHAPAALGLARRMLGDAALAEDVTQEAFVSMWRSRHLYRPERGSVRAWTLGITQYRAIDALRSGAVQARVIATIQSDPPRVAEPELTDVAVLRHADGLAARSALKALPDAQRRAIELAYFGGLTQAEIAEELKLPLGTVKGRLRLGLQKLREAVGPDEVLA